jgi:hypothetical protein
MNSTCYSIDQIQKDLGKFYIQLVYIFSYIEQSDYMHPVKFYFTSDALLGSALSSRHDEYYFKITEIQTDKGLVLPSISTIYTFELDSKTNYITAYNGVNIFEVFITGSNLKDIYQRKYIKFQDVIANTGGFIKFIMLFLSVINNYISGKFQFSSLIKNYESKLDILLKEKKFVGQILKKKTNETWEDNFLEKCKIYINLY